MKIEDSNVLRESLLLLTLEYRVYKIPIFSVVERTILNLCYVPNYKFSHGDLNDLASTDHSKLLFLFNAALEASELLLFAPVIEGSD